MLKTLFPACASFGPLFIAMGSLFPNRGESPLYGFFVAALGAFMTTGALMFLFRAVLAVERTPAPIQPSLTSKTHSA